MKTTLAAALAAVATLAAAPVFAQEPAPAATPASNTASAKMSVETTPIEVIASTPAGKAILDKDVPGMTAHEMYPQFKAMTLSQLVPMSQGQIPETVLKTVQADLDALK